MRNHEQAGPRPTGRARQPRQKTKPGQEPQATTEPTTTPVLITVRTTKDQSPAQILERVGAMDLAGLQVDDAYQPVLSRPASGTFLPETEELRVVRGFVPSDRVDEVLQQLRERPEVETAVRDVRIAPFGQDVAATVVPAAAAFLNLAADIGDCPIPPCDNDPGTPTGTLQDVVNHLGVNRIWDRGYRGEGIVIGMVDGGISAEGRPDSENGGSRRIPNVIGGWPVDSWGTVAGWGEHGNMTATDALGMAPNARLVDIRISDGSFISAALAGFDWALQRFQAQGTPQILSNSWGIYRRDWDEDYATDPEHPFTRKVVEVLDRGILVLFAAGNCGKTRPDGRCDSDNGPGRSIWGANGHPRVMTVGAANLRHELAGYSSQGPAALDQQKPDFCSITHFTGYTQSDAGTSAACPVAAGVVALLKQAKPSLTQAEAKQALATTAANLGQAGWDQHSGAGVIRAEAALNALAPAGAAAWTSLDGNQGEGLAAVSPAPGQLVIYGVGGNSRAIWTRRRTGGTWSDWAPIGPAPVAAASSPAAVANSDGSIDLVVTGTDRAAWHRRLTSGTG
jgi:serine protease AprX